MKVVVTNKKTFQVIEWTNIVRIELSGTNFIVTNSSNVSGTYAVADYNVHILGVSSLSRMSLYSMTISTLPTAV